jgi:hypothetical protein
MNSEFPFSWVSVAQSLLPVLLGFSFRLPGAPGSIFYLGLGFSHRGFLLPVAQSLLLALSFVGTVLLGFF